MEGNAHVNFKHRQCQKILTFPTLGVQWLLPVELTCLPKTPKREARELLFFNGKDSYLCL